MYGHTFEAGNPSTHGDLSGIACRVCGTLQQEHGDPVEETVVLKAREWVAAQMKSDLSGRNRTIRDWVSAKKLVWRIRRKKQMWGRQP